MLALPPRPSEVRNYFLNSLSGLVPYRGRTKGEIIALAVTCAATGVIILIIVAYYFLNPKEVAGIGSQLVDLPNGRPFEIPSPSVFLFYVKPITILFASGVIFSFSLCSLSERYIARYAPRWLRVLLLLFSALLLAMGIYEVFFNFSLWSALIASNPGVSPDLLTNDYPISTVMNNLAYATKISVLWCVVAFFALMTFRASLSESS
jgi:hypothetical protein